MRPEIECLRGSNRSICSEQSILRLVFGASAGPLPKFASVSQLHWNGIPIRVGSYLMVREDESVGDNDILAAASHEDDHLSDVIRGQWIVATNQYVSFLAQLCQYIIFPQCLGLDSRINRIGLALIAIKPDHAEIGLNLTRINLHDPDAGGDELLA
jgi:hypothetical protein